MTGSTKVFDGNAYLEGETTYNTDISDGYVFISDGNYYNRGLVSFGADSTASDTLEFIILKDNVPEGTTWTHATTIQDVAYVYTFSIDKKDFSYAVNGKTYDKVIKVKLDISFNFLGTPFQFATEYIYFAYEVGIIQTQVELFGTSTLSSNLSSYTLK